MSTSATPATPATPASPSPLAPTPTTVPAIHAKGSEGTRLKLPNRGDRLALWGWQAAVGLYAFLVLAFITSLVTAREAGTSRLSAFRQVIGLGAHANIILTLLVVLGLGVAAFAAWFAFRDVRVMAAEEEDIAWADDKGRDWLALVMVSSSAREALFRKFKGASPEQQQAEIAKLIADEKERSGVRVESLLDSRVQLVMNAVGGGGDSAAIIPEELRLIAEKRTSAYGAAARYASSLLLLFAVLGTFAGVKTALPGLIHAVGQSGSGASMLQVADALRAVADAFGGNALALIGAIALGLMSQAITLGRRNLLERLELVSAAYVYRDEGVSNSNPLVSAVNSLERTAREIRESNGALIGIEGGLLGLSNQFKTSFAELEERLASLADQHQSDLYDKTAQALHALNVQVTQLADAVRSNAGIYGGLVDQIGERAAESREAGQRLSEANRELASALRAVTDATGAARQAFGNVEVAASGLTEATGAVRTEVAGLSAAVRESMPAFGQMENVMQRALDRMDTLDQRAAEVWERTGKEVSKSIAEVTRSTGGVRPMVTSSGMPSGDSTPLLREIASELSALRAKSPSTLLLVAIPLGSALLGAGLLLGGWLLFR